MIPLRFIQFIVKSALFKSTVLTRKLVKTVGVSNRKDFRGRDSSQSIFVRCEGIQIHYVIPVGNPQIATESPPCFLIISNEYTWQMLSAVFEQAVPVLFSRWHVFHLAPEGISRSVADYTKTSLVGRLVV